MAVPSQVPVRYPSGVSTDPPFGPLANFGQPNPFMYHYFEDDFDYIATLYTQTKTGNGTIALAAGDGGLGLFTTNSSTPAGTDICAVQLPAASFSITLGKKHFFLTRLQLSSATNAAFNVGLIQTSATPMTVVDGIWFNKASGALNNLKLQHSKASTVTTLNIPTNVYTLANNTNIDLAWYIDRNGNIFAFVGAQLVGWFPQSERPTGQVAGPCGEITGLTASTFTTANLNVTLCVQSGTAASSTMTVDFVFAGKER